MHVQNKRLFVGNLPPDIAEKDIEKKFSKFGNVNSVCIKQRVDGFNFAFMDLEADDNMLSLCFKKFSEKKWNGYSLKLELAKESFLSRLEKERQENSEKDSHNRITQNRTFENENYADSKSEVHNSKLKTFQRTENYKENNIKTDEIQPISKSVNHSEDILNRLESFNDTWKDSETSYELRKKQKNESTKRSKQKTSISNLNQDLNVDNNLSYETPVEQKSERLKKKKKKTSINGKNDPADIRRLKSLDEKIKSFTKQKEIIKLALTSVDSHSRKKIVFDDDGEEMKEEISSFSNNVAAEDEAKKKLTLFDEGSEGEDDYEIKIKSQFEGKKGQKLLELQSRYSSDKRFTLDERFYENDEVEEVAPEEEVNDFSEERKQQLDILKDVVGEDLVSEKSKKNLKSIPMLRYDPTISDHSKFQKEIKPKKKKLHIDILESEPGNKKKKKENHENDNEITVSKKKFYKVDDTLKDSFKKKETETTFSLLGQFGTAGGSDNEEHSEEYKTVKLEKGKKSDWIKNPFKYDSSDTEAEDEIEKHKQINENKHETRKDQKTKNEYPQKKHFTYESLFFKPDDPRLQEGLEFFGRTYNEEKPYIERRRELQCLVRYKVKRNERSSSKHKNNYNLNNNYRGLIKVVMK